MRTIRIILGIVSYILFSWIFKSIVGSFLEDDTNLLDFLKYIDAVPAIVAFIICFIFQINYEDDYHVLIAIAILGTGYAMSVYMPYSIGLIVLLNLIYLSTIVFYAYKLK